MTAPLFFADDGRLAAAEIGDVVELGGAEGRHAATVRRLVVGERLDLSDGAGLLCAAEVTAVVGQVLHARVLERVLVPQPVPRITVVQALAKGDRDERAVETMTEGRRRRHRAVAGIPIDCALGFAPRAESCHPLAHDRP